MDSVPPLDRILRRPEVLRLTGISDTTLWRVMRREGFPKPIRLSTRACGWRESSVRECLASRTAGPIKISTPKRPRPSVAESAAI
jgi:prophage regulatory protein